MHYNRVRSGTTCPRCFGPKDFGLLLCWPCHTAETEANGGKYSSEVEFALDEMEQAWIDYEEYAR